MLYVFLKCLVGPFIYILWRPVVHGKNNLRVKGKAVFVCNHISLGDPILIGLITPRIVHFMAKKELFQSKIGRAFFSALCAFPVDRKTADLKSLKNALKVLEKGKIFGIFPEGKRAVSDSLDELERGAALLAIRSGAPVIPMYIHPSSYRRVHPVVMVGKPINISNIIANSKKSTLVEVVSDEIADAIDALKVELEELYCLS